MKLLLKAVHFLLLITVLYLATLTKSQFTNEVVACDDITYKRKCTLRTNDKDIIQQRLADSFNGTFDTIIITIGADFAGATINLSPTTRNVKVLEIINSADSYCYLEAMSVNLDLKHLKLSGNEFYLKQNDFFTFFPNLETVKINSLVSRYIPIFTSNLKIRKISVRSSTIEEENSRIINDTIFGSLQKLKYIVWANGGITEVARNALNGLTALAGLSLDGNNIMELHDSMFESLEKLATIALDGNNIRKVGADTFLGLTNVFQLFLNDNPTFPLSSITHMKNLRILLLNGYNTQYLERRVIEQFPKLSHLYLLHTSLNCTCEYRWVTQLEHFGINVFLKDKACVGNLNQEADDPTLYSSCGERSFQCFDKSIECVGENWNRVDTLDGCECVYPEEPSNVSEVNECEDSSICQGNCTKTPGSYKCSCLEGFYNVNDTLCGDIDECMVGNGNCSQICSNLFGSFECFCLAGYRKEGFSDCVDINECLLNNGNCSHTCTNREGAYGCSCPPGYKKKGPTECVLGHACSVNNGGCHHNCTENIGSYVCSCLEGFKASPSNSSHCDTDMNAGLSEHNTTSLFYVLFFLCLLSITIMVLLCVSLILVFLYFRRQIKLLKSNPASDNLSAAELDNFGQKELLRLLSTTNANGVKIDTRV